MRDATPQANATVNSTIRLGATWSRALPSGARIIARHWHRAEVIEDSGGAVVPAYESEDEDLDIFLGALGGQMIVDGDVDLSADEADIKVAPELAHLLDAAVAVARHFTLPPPASHAAGEKIRDLRDALIALGYVRSEVTP